MPPINRLIQSNGRTRVPKLPFADDQNPASRSDVADKLNQVLRDHPGTLILVGLAVGGLLGWLTSQRKR